MGRACTVLENVRQELRNPRRRWLVFGSLALIALCGYFTIQFLNTDYHLRAGRRALEAKDFPTAQTHLLRALARQPGNPEIHLLLARTARRTGDFAAAQEHLEKCQRLGGIQEAIDLERDLLLAQRGDLSSSRETFLWANVKVGHPDSVLILEALADGYLQSTRLENALGALDELLKQRPDDTHALLLRGKIRYHRTRYDQAASDFHRILDDLDPNHDEARRYLAKSLLDANQFPQAISQFHKLAEAHPDDAEILLGLARCERALKKVAEARTLLDSLVERFPANVDIQVERAQLDLDALDFDKAEARLRLAVEKNPFHRGAVSRLVRCLSLGKKPDLDTWKTRLKELERSFAKLEDVSRQLELKPGDAALRFETGKLLIAVGREQDGLTLLRGALNINPTYPEAHQFLSQYYRQKGLKNLAAEHERAGK